MMTSVRIVPRRESRESHMHEPEGEDDGLLVWYDPNDPASVDRARAAMARMFGMDRGPSLFGCAPYVPFWQKWTRLLQDRRAASRMIVVPESPGILRSV